MNHVKHSLVFLMTAATLTLGVLVVTTLPSVAAETEMVMPTTPEEHAAAAERFDQEALDLESKATNHAETASRYKARMTGMSGKQAHSQHRFHNHCEKLAKAYQSAAVEAREMAKMHREMAQPAKP